MSSCQRRNYENGTEWKSLSDRVVVVAGFGSHFTLRFPVRNGQALLD
jgi:hypothetical protein